MRLSSSFAFVLAFASAGCGDSTTASGGGGNGAGGTGGVPTTGGGGQGGMPSGAPIGDPCMTNDDCAGGLCLTEDYYGWAKGYCTALCEPTLLPCVDGVCVAAPGGSNLCLKQCATPADCPGVGQDCIDLGNEIDPFPVCVGGCDDNSQCAHACDEDNSVCVLNGEVCDNGADDDMDGLHDCIEADCATDAGCIQAIGDACDAATPLADGVEIDDTTADGTDLFAGICTNLIGDFPTGLAHEKVYSYTAAGKGIVTFMAHAIDGDLALYTRSTCSSNAAQLACADAQANAGTDEVLVMSVTAGEAITVFVDAFSTIGEGDFTLLATFQPEICGDGVTIGAEQCDDDNTTSGDGCSATCQVEPAAFCVTAAVTDVVVDVPVAGDTTNGTAGFAGSCAGEDGRELIYRYTPLVTGNVRITVNHDPQTPTLDAVLYTRTDCADDTSEILCRDVGIAGDDETMLLPATLGEPIIVFVDSYASDTEGPFTLTVEPM